MVSMEECSSLMQNLMQIYCSTHSDILNVTATQYTCSLNGIYCPLLTSTVKLLLFTLAYSSPLSLAARLYRCHINCSHYINSGWTFSGQTLYFLNKYSSNPLTQWFPKLLTLKFSAPDGVAQWIGHLPAN